MEEKLLVLTWTKEQLDAYDDEHDFVKECLNEAAKVIGYYAIMNPYTSIQWIGNELKENKEAEWVRLYVKVKIFAADNPEYYERTKRVEDFDDDGSED